MNAIAPRLSRLDRLKLLHPVRLYTWPALALLLIVIVAPVIAAGAWPALWLYLPAWGLTVAAVEAARVSTLAPADVVRALRDSHR